MDNYDYRISAPPERSLFTAMRRGFCKRCPQCGKGPLFKSYLKVYESCKSCGEDLHHQRADDAPPYFVITIIGHIIIPAAFFIELSYRPAMWIHALTWLPLTLIGSLLLLPYIKGAIVGLQWANFMHGFGNPDNHDTE